MQRFIFVFTKSLYKINDCVQTILKATNTTGGMFKTLVDTGSFKGASSISQLPDTMIPTTMESKITYIVK